MNHDSLQGGIFDPDGTLAGSKLVAAHIARILSQSCDTTLIHRGKPGSLDEVSSFFDVDLSDVRERALARYSPVPARPSTRLLPLHLWRLLLRQRGISSPYDLFISSAGYSLPPTSRAGYSAVYCHFPYASVRPDPGERDPSGLWEGAKRVLHQGLLTMRLSSYDLVLANSEFTARWIRHRWNRSAEVLPPPVSADPPLLEKEDLVVSVGRFDPQDTKNHRTTIEAFKQFVDRSRDGDWRLCIIGSLRDNPATRSYMESLRELARGYRVDLETHVERDHLLRRLARARFYWHSKGLGGMVTPAYQEHFGISTVEAMRARCVPVVPNAGGQPEIVTHGRSGFLCDDVEGMVAASLRLSADPDLTSRMSSEAHRESLAYTADAFAERLEDVLRQHWHHWPG